jgi:integrase
MASVKKRERGEKVTYIARWRDPDGRQRMKTFARKGDADRFAATVEADKLRGTYLDPKAGTDTFEVYASRWLAAQTFDEGTRDMVGLRLRTHVYPVLGGKQLRQVRTSMVQAWLRGLSELAPSYQRVIYANVSAIFAAAVDDEQLARSPFRAASIRAPRVQSRKVKPWPAEQVIAVTAALPPRYAIVATLAAGLGLRQGEVFGLSPDDVDFLRGEVEVRRQVKILGSRHVFAPPKGGRHRTVPLPAHVRDQLAAHLARFPARRVQLPWRALGTAPVTVSLAVTTREALAVNRNHFNGYIWKPALEVAEVEPSRENGCHALRHFYASVLLDRGVSIRAVSEYLGHHDPGFTLRTYTHLMPQSDDRARTAVDEALDQDQSAHLAHRISSSSE